MKRIVFHYLRKFPCQLSSEVKKAMHLPAFTPTDSIESRFDLPPCNKIDVVLVMKGADSYVVRLC